MDIAALIISILALLMAGASLTWQLAKHFSTHTIQMVSADSVAIGKAKIPTVEEQYREFDEVDTEPLSDAEKEYFKKHATP